MTTTTKCRAANPATCRTHGEGARQFATDYHTDTKGHHIANMTGDAEKLQALRPQLLKLLPKSKAVSAPTFYASAAKKLNVNLGYVSSAIYQMVVKGELSIAASEKSEEFNTLQVKKPDTTSTWAKAARIFDNGGLVDADIQEKYAPHMLYSAIKEQAHRDGIGIRAAAKNLVEKYEAKEMFGLVEKRAASGEYIKPQRFSTKQKAASKEALRNALLQAE